MKVINDLSRHIKPIESQIGQAIQRVISSGWFILGPEVDSFEVEFASYCGVKYCVSVANGTDALEIALRALNIGNGSKVLTVANAGMYSTLAILATGATPIFVDVESDNMLMDLSDAIDQIDNYKIDAIVITHLYGLVGNIEKLIQIANSKNIPIIEDCAQAHGALKSGKKAGTFGTVGCFSFYPTKNLGGLGDGGAVITNCDSLKDNIKQLRQYGWASKYHATLSGGRNSRLDEIQAAVLRLMLPMLDSWNVRRREIAVLYSKGIIHKEILTPAVCGNEYVAHLYVIRTTKRNSLMKYLSEAGIPTDIHYPIPDYNQLPCKFFFSEIRTPITEMQCNQVLSLPCFPEMTDEEIQYVIATLNRWRS